MSGSEFPLNKDSVSIGRAPANDIIIPDPEISDLQARLRLGEDGWTLFNCTPETRVFIRDIPVDRCQVKPGIPFRIGQTLLQLSFPDSDSAAAIREDRQLFHPGRAIEKSQVQQRETELPSGLSTSTPTDAPQQPEPVNWSTRTGLIATAAVILAVIAGALVIHTTGRPSPRPPLQHILVQEGGAGSMVSILPFVYDQIGGPGGEKPWQHLVEVRQVDPPIMVEVLGKNQGKAEVPLYQRGKPLLTLRITIRGKVRAREIFHADRSLDDLLRQGTALLERGRQLQRDHLCEAIENCFRPTANFMSKLDDAKAKRLADRARLLLSSAEGLLDRRLSDFEAEFWDAYYLKDYHRSLRQLCRIAEWVPDETDKRYQRAAILEEYVLSLLGEN